MTDRERPWFKFYPSDWRADQALRVCSLAARGLWMECLCICHEATPYGHLLINGRPPTDAQLAALAGTPLDQIPGLLDELESAGVFSRTRTGVIYSRRMTRDEKRRSDGDKAQKTGAKLPNSRRSQAVEKKEKKPPPPGVRGGVVDPPPSPQSPEARSQSPESSSKPPSPQVQPKDLADEIWAMAGEDPDRKRVRGVVEDIRLVKSWLAEHPPDAIRRAAKAIIGRSTNIRSLWGLLAKAMPEELARDGEAEPEGKVLTWEDKMRHRAKVFLERGATAWPSSWGPRPGEDRCEVPRPILAEMGLLPEPEEAA